MKHNNSKEQQNNKTFNLQEVGFKDLDGNFVQINFDQKDFANSLFKAAQSIDMDIFARAIHQDGKAELTDQVQNELLQTLQSMYQHRAVEAIKETIENLK